MQMKRLFVRYSVLLLVLLLMASVVGCIGGVEEVPSVDNPDIIVFQTSNSGILMLAYLLAAYIFGLGGLAIGIIMGWISVKAFAKESNKLKWLGYLSLWITLALGGAFLLTAPFYSWPYLESITVDQSSRTIVAERKYFLRDETLNIAFADIFYVKWSQRDSGERAIGEVTLVLWGGGEVELSSDGPKAQYEMARSISAVAHKILIEDY